MKRMFGMAAQKAKGAFLFGYFLLRSGNVFCGGGFSRVPLVGLEKRCVWGTFCAVVISL